MKRSALYAAILFFSLAGSVAGAHVTQACTIDGKATALANGTRAVLSGLKLTGATVRTWAPFSFPGRYREGASIRFSEDRKQLQSVLTTAALRYAWRWQFGDGTQASGWTVTHRYAHPGAYRITVLAYEPAWHQYFSFDTVRIVVTR